MADWDYVVGENDQKAEIPAGPVTVYTGENDSRSPLPSGPVTVYTGENRPRQGVPDGPATVHGGTNARRNPIPELDNGARAAVVQSNFHGGEWSKKSHGRIDLPEYRKAMETSSNGLATEEGAWTRRVGTFEIGKTMHGMDGIIADIDIGTSLPSITQGGSTAYTARAQFPAILELTYDEDRLWSRLRVWTLDASGGLPSWANAFLYAPACHTFVDVTAFSAADPTVVTCTSTTGLLYNDVLIFTVHEDAPPANMRNLVNRQFVCTGVPSATTFTCADALTGIPLNAADVEDWTNSGTTQVGFVWQMSAPYESLTEVKQTRIVATAGMAVFLCGTKAPWLLTWEIDPTTGDPDFTFADAGFVSTTEVGIDGPYLDPPIGASQTGNGLGSISAGTTTPSFQITDSSGTFVADDVGRQIRLWSQPPAWDSATAYATDDAVTYDGSYWTFTSTTGQTGVYPGTSVTTSGVSEEPWSPTTNLGMWAHGVITARTNSTTVVCLLNEALPYATNGAVIDTYALGAYTDNGTVYPSTGTFHEGRLCLGGAIPDRFDMSMANGVPDGEVQVPLFSPSDKYGEVDDDHAITYRINSDKSALMLWMLSLQQGLLIGTLRGEWMITAATVDESLSPTSINCKSLSDFGSASTMVRPIRVGNVLLFLSRDTYTIKEFFADSFSGRWQGRNLNTRYQEVGPFLDMVYQPDRNPMLIAYDTIGGFHICTYRRDSSLNSADPVFAAWSQHGLGSGNLVIGAVAVPSANGSLSTTVLLTKNAGHGYYQLEQLSFFWPVWNPLIGSTIYLDGVCIQGGGDAGFSPAAACDVFGTGLTGGHILTTNDGQTVQGGNYAANEIANTCPVLPGYYYLEASFDSGTSADDDGIGFSTTGAVAADIATSWTNGVGFGTANPGNIYVNGSAVTNFGAAVTTGTRISIAINTIDGRIHLGKGAAVGYSPSQHNVGGTDISSIIANIQTRLVALFRTSTADKFTLYNSGFSYAIPPGFATGWQGVIPNEATYSALDTTSAVSMSFGPKYYGAKGGSATNGVRSHVGRARGSGGKRYLEFTCGSLGNNSTWCGVCDSSQTLNAAMNASHAKGITAIGNANGQLYNSAIGRMVVDLTNSLLWIKGQTSDDWNLSGTANPSTGVGGIDISALSSTIYIGFGTPGVDSETFVFISNPEWFIYSIPSDCVGGW